ncbi:MAG: putative transcriptional regulator [Deltaproteobacteria bacterium]|nr:putative transcriptional regulator [Deltaproteobacteria bacterium]
MLIREPDTDFSEVGTHFIVTFMRKHFREGDIAPQETEQEPAEEKTTQKTTQKTLDEIKVNPKITRKELAFKIGVGEDGIKFHLTNLRKKGILKRIGPDKGGYWDISAEG